MEFSEILKNLQVQDNMSQEELAEKLTISLYTLASYEQGRRYPSFNILIRISQLFNVNVDKFLFKDVRKRRFNYLIISIILLFLGNILNLIALYSFGIKEDRLFNIVFSFSIYMTPLIYMIIYLVLHFYPPRRINRFCGYRTKASMKNQMMWITLRQVLV